MEEEEGPEAAEGGEGRNGKRRNRRAKKVKRTATSRFAQPWETGALNCHAPFIDAYCSQHDKSQG